MKQAVKNLFDYDEIIPVELRNYFIFTNAKLKQDFGPHKAGTTIPEIHLDGRWIYIRTNPENPAHQSGADYNFPLSFSYDA